MVQGVVVQMAKCAPASAPALAGCTPGPAPGEVVRVSGWAGQQAGAAPAPAAAGRQAGGQAACAPWASSGMATKMLREVWPSGYSSSASASAVRLLGLQCTGLRPLHAHAAANGSATVVEQGVAAAGTRAHARSHR